MRNCSWFVGMQELLAKAKVTLRRRIKRGAATDRLIQTIGGGGGKRGKRKTAVLN